MDSSRSTIVRVNSICVWARLVVNGASAASAWPQLFDMLAQDSARNLGYSQLMEGSVGPEEISTAGGLLSCIVDRTTDMFDDLVTLPRKKLVALALCRVLASTGDPSNGATCGFGAM